MTAGAHTEMNTQHFLLVASDWKQMLTVLLLAVLLTAPLFHCLPVSLPACLTPCLFHCSIVSLPACLIACLSHCLPDSLPACLSACLSHCSTVSLPALLIAPRSYCLPVSLLHCLDASPFKAALGKIWTKHYGSQLNEAIDH